MLITSIIRMCKGKINEPKAENHLNWETQLSVFYYFYSSGESAALMVEVFPPRFGRGKMELHVIL